MIQRWYQGQRVSDMTAAFRSWTDKGKAECWLDGRSLLLLFGVMLARVRSRDSDLGFSWGLASPLTIHTKSTAPRYSALSLCLTKHVSFSCLESS